MRLYLKITFRDSLSELQTASRPLQNQCSCQMYGSRLARCPFKTKPCQGQKTAQGPQHIPSVCAEDKACEVCVCIGGGGFLPAGILTKATVPR